MVESQYSKLNNPEEIQNQRFVDRFNGNDLDERWLTSQQTGSTTFQMADVIDGGFEIMTDQIINTNGFMSFNDIRHYSPTDSVFVVIVASLLLTDNFTFVGLIDSFPGTTDAMFFRIDSLTAPNIIFRTADAGVTEIDTGVAQDTNFHRYEGQLTSTFALGFIDGILRATSTTDLPLTKLQPFMRQGTRATANQTTGRIRYFEAFNK